MDETVFVLKAGVYNAERDSQEEWSIKKLTNGMIEIVRAEEDSNKELNVWQFFPVNASVSQDWLSGFIRGVSTGYSIPQDSRPQTPFRLT